jgi:hypothetical protein
VAFKVNLYLLGETDGRTHYVEETVGDDPPVLGAVSVENTALPQPPPAMLEVTVEFGKPRPTAPAPDLSRFVPPPQEVLHAGDKVTIVKDRDSGIRYPPEWLEQYLGRSGRILWTTAGGAMVKLEKGATWFPYGELERTEKL